MEEQSIYNKLHYYLFYALALATLTLSILSLNIYLISISSLLLFAAAIFLHSGHVINNLLIKRSRIIEIKNGYKLSRNLAAASRQYGRAYCSIAIALLRPRQGFIYKSENIKDLIEGIKEPFEFSISLQEVDKKGMLDSLESKRRMKEIYLSRLKPNSYDKINSIRRQIEVIDSEMSNIIKSGKSFQVLMKIKAISKSDNEYESELAASKSIEMLANKFSASIGLDYQILKGEELLDFSG
ncbi:MAG: hypothetical protein KGH64_03590 [Candidatus Micrarchaeota archaeon]|nr:hypothetical protein [Candidatus Micrarchaeota archaeon]MDE1834393.1 hypothetical protein [Candidatus Micrarchaeota archaeon]